MSEVFDWKNKIDERELNKVCSCLKNGELIVFPTETVYGIGGDAFEGEVCSKIFEAKGRPSDNPLIVHVSDIEMLEKCVKSINEVERKLIDAFMPGPFTLILPKNEIIPNIVTAGLDTVAVRMPDNIIANIIIKEFGRPIAAPSANKSGRPSGTKILDIKEELENNVSAFIDGGNTEIGIESTVVRVVEKVPIILRPGAVTREDIFDLIGQVRVDEHVLSEVRGEDKVLSPGMKHKHYAPKTRCVLLEIKDEVDRRKIVDCLENKKVVVVGLNDSKGKFEKLDFWGIGDNLEEFSKNIFSTLREADMMNYELILIESVNLKGIGLAVMNRLLRTCGYNIVSNEKQVLRYL